MSMVNSNLCVSIQNSCVALPFHQQQRGPTLSSKYDTEPWFWKRREWSHPRMMYFFLSEFGGIVLWTAILHPLTADFNIERRSSQEEEPQNTSGSNRYTDLKPLLRGKEVGWFIAPRGTLELAPLAAELISSKVSESFTGMQSVDDQVLRSSVNLVI